MPKTMQELSDNFAERIKQQAESCFIEEEFIVFKFWEDNTYEVPLAECDSYKRILQWQLHLSEKQWITMETLIGFTILACDHHQLPIFP